MQDSGVGLYLVAGYEKECRAYGVLNEEVQPKLKRMGRVNRRDSDAGRTVSPRKQPHLGGDPAGALKVGIAEFSTRGSAGRAAQSALLSDAANKGWEQLKTSLPESLVLVASARLRCDIWLRRRNSWEPNEQFQIERVPALRSSVSTDAACHTNQARQVGAATSIAQNLFYMTAA